MNHNAFSDYFLKGLGHLLMIKKMKIAFFKIIVQNIKNLLYNLSKKITIQVSRHIYYILVC